jgi:two-component system chemotaxis response regulator CheY
MAKILVVDDEPAFADFAKILLAGLGHTAILCLDSARAVELAASQRPDVIITDLNMPQLDGLELIGQLKARPETRDIPVLLASSSTDKQDRIEAQRLGAVYSIVKPLQTEMLKILLGQVLRSPKP